MKRLITLALVFALVACRKETPAPATPQQAAPASAASTSDPHSYSRPDEVRVEHIALDLGVDFAKKQLSGTATLRIRNEKKANMLVLDAHTLDIRRVTLQPGNTQAQFQVGPVDAVGGSALDIRL